jgi:aryl-alcohol dehydrogenase-like predicted oxidoreductase
MRYQAIGRSGIKASVVGLGTWVTGGWLWGGSDEQESIKTIHCALDHHINLIDTAPVYGFGRSEEIVGKALQDRREKAVLVTKCGQIWHTSKGKHAFDSEGKSVYHYLGPESVRYELEQSLRRLQTDYIDVYLVHVPDVTTPVSRTMEELVRLKTQGKIRAIGVSNMSPDQLREYAAAGPLDVDQEKIQHARSTN